MKTIYHRIGIGVYLLCLLLIYGWAGNLDEDCYYYFADFHLQGRFCDGYELTEKESIGYAKLSAIALFGILGLCLLFYKPRKS